jgi:uncharacterized protein Yka (UPF0111/DUF47 family)
MISWFQAMMPKEEKFFDHFERHALTIVAGAHALRALLEGGEKTPDHCKDIKRYKNEADDITREVLLAVRRTFITPFDRGDIRDLITVMDDTIDQMHQTAKATLLYDVRAFEAPMRRMGDIIDDAAELTKTSIPLLRAMHQNAGNLSSFSEEIVRFEEEADDLHDQGLSALLIYANSNWEDVTFREELEDLGKRLNLEVTHVLGEPPARWTGERARLSIETLKRCVPAPFDRHIYFICGPEPMMDPAEAALAALGVPMSRYHSERYSFA